MLVARFHLLLNTWYEVKPNERYNRAKEKPSYL